MLNFCHYSTFQGFYSKPALRAIWNLRHHFSCEMGSVPFLAYQSEKPVNVPHGNGASGHEHRHERGRGGLVIGLLFARVAGVACVLGLQAVEEGEKLPDMRVRSQVVWLDAA